MYTSSHQIANFFIRQSQATGAELTPMKLIKLCYIAHGWHLGFFDEQLLDEAIFAWKYGPVIDTLYRDFKKYGTGQITELYKDEKSGEYEFPDISKTEFLNSIWNAYRRFNGVQLSAMTHDEGTPWDITWNRNGGKNRRAAIIPNDLIKAHYKEKIAANDPSRTAEPALN